MDKQQNGELVNFYESQKVPMSVRALRFYFNKIGWMFPKQSAELFWKLFTTPKSRKIKDWHKEFLSTAKKDRFELNHNEYLTYEWGTGDKTVVMVHGWEGMTTDFKRIIDALLKEGGFRIIAIDFPAHGLAAGKQSHMLKFIEGLQYLLKKEQKVHAVIGHSLGANSSFFSLANLKDEVEVEHLVMLGSYPIPYHFFKTFKTFMKIPHNLFEKMVDHVEDKYLDGREVRALNMYEQRYKMPVNKVLLVHDEHDEVANIDKVKALAAEWDKVSVLFGTHGGHFKHFRHPEVVNRVVEQLKTSAFSAATVNH
jgi:pimeloyl-ACP methyl ester carboxylesterase